MRAPILIEFDGETELTVIPNWSSDTRIQQWLAHNCSENDYEVVMIDFLKCYRFKDCNIATLCYLALI